jgi:hypothetical protein
MAKKEKMPAMEQKPGKYWDVIGRQHLPLGKGGDRKVSASQQGRDPSDNDDTTGHLSGQSVRVFRSSGVKMLLRLDRL